MVYDQDILDIARTTIHSLKQIGIDECCFVGGMACNLYTHAYTFSEGREPNDLDILCLTPYAGGAEAIKERLCQTNSHFRTVHARNPNDWWNVLWYHWSSNKFKIDILTPGVYQLPYIHPNYITNILELPCAPLDILLFTKLNAWAARPGYLRAKMPEDAKDIRDLTVAAYHLQLDITVHRPYITNVFRNASYTRVRMFIRQYPNTAQHFVDIGLPESMCAP